MSWPGHDVRWKAPSRRCPRERILELEQKVENLVEEIDALRAEVANRCSTNAALVEVAQDRATQIRLLQRTVREQKAELDNVHRALAAASAQSVARETKGPKGTGRKPAKGSHPPAEGHGRAPGGRKLYPEHFALKASRTQEDPNVMTDQEPE